MSSANQVMRNMADFSGVEGVRNDIIEGRCYQGLGIYFRGDYLILDFPEEKYCTKGGRSVDIEELEEIAGFLNESAELISKRIEKIKEGE